MFNNLTKSLNKVFDKISGRRKITEDDLNSAMREIRIALLEADVSLPVVKKFIKDIKEKLVGAEVVKSVSPAQMIIKLVNDELREILGGESEGLDLKAKPPVVVMMVGLQGSGKTTTSAKLALNLHKKHNKKILLASLDVDRPAAQEQLEVLAKQVDVASLDIVPGQNPIKIAKRAIEEAKKFHYDVLILDTAGRLHIDNKLMEELKQIKEITEPNETLLVADSLTGQDAVNIAKTFKEEIGVTGIVLTRIDGDGRGGSAISMRMTTGCPIKYLGVGEKLEDLEEFHPDRIASRILDMGDIVTLVEKAKEVVDEKEAAKLAKKMQKGRFDFNDLLKQLRTLKKMGGMGSLMKFLPMAGKIQDMAQQRGFDESIISKQEAIILSMTIKERSNPDLLNSSRKRRIAAGSGTTIQELNSLLKRYKQMNKMMEKIRKMDKSQIRSAMGEFGNMDSSQLQDLAKFK